MKSKFVASGLAIVFGVAIPFGDVREAIAVEREGTIAQAPVDGRRIEADRLLQQGIQQYEISQFEASLKSLQQSLKLYREIKHRKGEALTLSLLGLIYSSTSDYPKAIDVLEKSLIIARELNDREIERLRGWR